MIVYTKLNKPSNEASNVSFNFHTIPCFNRCREGLTHETWGREKKFTLIACMKAKLVTQEFEISKV